TVARTSVHADFSDGSALLMLAPLSFSPLKVTGTSTYSTNSCRYRRASSAETLLDGSRWVVTVVPGSPDGVRGRTVIPSVSVERSSFLTDESVRSPVFA